MDRKKQRAAAKNSGKIWAAVFGVAVTGVAAISSAAEPSTQPAQNHTATVEQKGQVVTMAAVLDVQFDQNGEVAGSRLVSFDPESGAPYGYCESDGRGGWRGFVNGYPPQMPDGYMRGRVPLIDGFEHIGAIESMELQLERVLPEGNDPGHNLVSLRLNEKTIRNFVLPMKPQFLADDGQFNGAQVVAQQPGRRFVCFDRGGSGFGDGRVFINHTGSKVERPMIWVDDQLTLKSLPAILVGWEFEAEVRGGSREGVSGSGRVRYGF